MPKLLLPLVALALAGGATGAYFLVTSGGGEEEVVAQPTPTATTTPSVTPTAAATPTPSLQTYRNEKYRYEVTLPEGWRLASLFMDRFAERISQPGLTVIPEDYVVLTSLNEDEERQAVEEASGTVALGLEPWLGFAKGRSVYIFPIDVIYPGVSGDSFLTDVDTAGVIRSHSEVTEETLISGEVVTRATRRELDDNGDFTYDLVLVRMHAIGDKDLIIRVVKTPDYDKQAFDAIFRSFTRE